MPAFRRRTPSCAIPESREGFSHLYRSRYPARNGHLFTNNVFVDFDPEQRRATTNTFLPNGPPELRNTIEIPSTMTAQLHGLVLQDGVGMIKFHPIVWAGKPAHELVLGF
jgi:hypothetical protein